jgi:hypothetical protein
MSQVSDVLGFFVLNAINSLITNLFYSKTSKESDILDYFVPNAIFSEIFSKFLLFQDISRFDIAICNKNKRPLYLECVGSKSCIWLGGRDQDFSSYGISRLVNRSIKIWNLKCHRVNYNIARQISSIGSCLYWLSINCEWTYYCSSIVDDILTQIVRGCPALRCLDLSSNVSISDIGMIMLVENCPNLQSLYVDDVRNQVTDVGVMHLAEGYPNLEDLRLNDFNSIEKDALLIKLKKACPKLHALKFDSR